VSTRARRILAALSLAAPVAVILVGSSSICRNRPRPWLDEYYWIGSAYCFDLAFRQRDWSHEDWLLQPAIENPPVGRYLIGLSLAAFGERVDTPDQIGLFYLGFKRVPGAWGHGKYCRRRLEVVERVDPESRKAFEETEVIPMPHTHLRVGRSLMAIAGILASLCVYWIGARCFAPRAGFLAAMLFACHPVTVKSSALVGVDIIAALFSLLAVAHLVLICGGASKSGSGNRIRLGLLAVTGGLSLGLACGSKANAGIVAILGAVLFSAFFVQVLRGRRADFCGALLASGAMLVLSVVTFVVLNPTLYHGLFSGIWALCTEVNINADFQAEFLPQRLRTLGERIVETSVLTGLGALGFLAIASAVVYQTMRNLRPASPKTVLILWWFVAFIAIAVWLPFPWERYVLPLIIPSALLVGASVDELIGH